MAIDLSNRTEFSLTIKRYGPKNDPYMGHYPDEKVEEEVKEELTFKGLSAAEAMRKLLDYLREY